MVDKITEDQASEYRDAFTLFDKRGDNKIDSSQIGDVMRALGLNPTEADVKKEVSELVAQDPAKSSSNSPNITIGNRRVSFEEFLPIFLSCQQKKEEGSMEDFIEGLKVFDKEGNGFINSAELRHVLTSLGEKMSDEEVDTLLAGVEDSQGQVNYEEFIKIVMAG